MRKFLLYILILVVVVLVGLFSSVTRVNAQLGCQVDSSGNPVDPNCVGTCVGTNFSSPSRRSVCTPPNTWSPVTATGTTANTSPASPPPPSTEFEKQIAANNCGISILGSSGTFWPGCFIQGAYGLFFVIPTYLLRAAAYFFNVLISITLGSKLLAGSVFISSAWAVVRDLSNLFFILILLYIAIKVILDIGGSEAKKMIVRVIIMALLINFSMFMTEVVIDTSNILALIFYNKLDVCTNKDPITGACRPYTTVTGEKDVSGAMTAAFNPTSLLSPTFFKNAGIQPTGIANVAAVQGNAPAGILIGITIIAGVLMFFAGYAFFIAGLSFVGRLIELWILIIFSPFAFMSWSIPLLNDIEYLGWKAWLSRLLKTSFMAPIFMFFMYFIFLVIQKGNPFGNIGIADNGGEINTILLVVIPALVILFLLLKATSFAKKGSGTLGEAIVKGGQALAGLAAGAAVGVATGGTALALRAGVGGGGGYVANKLASGANRFGLNRVASGLTRVGAYAQRSSFDVRGVKGVQSLAGAAGITLGAAQKGGIEQSRKEKVEKRMKRAEGLKVREDEGLKQNLNKMEIGLQKLLNDNVGLMRKLDKEIADARQELQDAAPDDRPAAAANLAQKKQDKKNFRMDTKDGLNRSIYDLENKFIPEQKDEIEQESRRRTVAFANRKGGWGRLSSTANKEARHKIIMGSKIESKGEAH